MGKLKVGFIGYGNMGGQLANAAASADIPSIAINTSKQDFETLNDDVNPFLVGDGNGTGKNRDTAKQFLSDRLNIVKDEKFIKFIEDKDIIFNGGSAGGGTGSGLVPSMTSILSQIYPDKCFIVITTFPSLKEQYIPQKHTEAFMKELLSLNVPYITYDNDCYKDLEATEMNKLIINKAVTDMRIIRGDFNIQTTTGGIDERDQLTLCSTPGRLICEVITNFEESMIEDASIVSTLKNAIAKSAHAPMVDDKFVEATGIMYNLTSDLKKYGSQISSDLENTFGKSITDYRNEAVDEDSEYGAFVACILAGLTAPTTRIDQTISRRQKLEDEINKRQAATTKLNSVEVGTLSLGTKSFGSSTKVQKPNVDDILANIKLL